MKVIKDIKIYEFTQDKKAVYTALFNMELEQDAIEHKGKTPYYNTVSAFDIETSTIKDGVNSAANPTGYAFMYIWQFCIMDIVTKKYVLVVGRTWNDFIEFTNQIQDIFNRATLVTYVHNLAYEWQFMRMFFEWSNVFLREKRVPLKAQTKNIEFRCSYFLSNMSLAKFIENSENITHPKQVGSLDYRKIRTPKTQLKNKELFYCIIDVFSLCECIIDKLVKFGDNIKTIPLTSTSYVRRDCRKMLQTNYPKNRHIFITGKINLHLYRLFKKAFRGGNTHTNRYYSMDIIKLLGSRDIASSYPTNLLKNKYPYGTFNPVDLNGNESKFQLYISKYAVLMTVEFFNISLKEHVSMPYIPTSKVEKLTKEGTIFDNGRIIKADYIKMTMTEVDFEIIQNQYNIGKYNEDYFISESYFAYKNYLPMELCQTIVNYFSKKTELKNVEGKEYEYNKSKNSLNGIYGMCVTDIINSDIFYIDDEYKNIDELTEEEKEINNVGDIDDNYYSEKIEQFFENRNNFLLYQWGVWCTAYARAMLQSGLDFIDTECKKQGRVSDVIYCDTDSIKFIYRPEYDRYFKEYNEKIKATPYPYGLPNFALDKKGIKHYMGLFENEGDEKTGIAYKKFISLGAKKYCYLSYKDKLGLTVSGLNKKAVQELNGKIDNFTVDRVFKGAKYLKGKYGIKCLYYKGGQFIDHSYTARTVAYYNDDHIHYIEVNEEKILTASNVAIIDSTYTLGVTKEYNLLVKGYK